MGIPMYGAGNEDRESGDDHKKAPVESPNILATENGRPLHCAYCRRAGHIVIVCPHARFYDRAAAAVVETEQRRRRHAVLLVVWHSHGQMGRGTTNSLAQDPSTSENNETGPFGHNSSRQ